MKFSQISLGMLLALFCVFFSIQSAMAAPDSDSGLELRLGLNAPVFKATIDGDIDFKSDTDTIAGFGMTFSLGYRFMFMGVYLEQNLAGIFGEQNYDYEDSRFYGSTYGTLRFIGSFDWLELEGGVGLGAMYMVSAHPDIMLDADGSASSAVCFAMKFTIGATARFGGFGVGLHLDYELGINPQSFEVPPMIPKVDVMQLLHNVQPGIHFLYKF